MQDRWVRWGAHGFTHSISSPCAHLQPKFLFALFPQDYQPVLLSANNLSSPEVITRGLLKHQHKILPLSSDLYSIPSLHSILSQEMNCLCSILYIKTLFYAESLSYQLKCMMLTLGLSCNIQFITIASS